MLLISLSILPTILLVLLAIALFLWLLHFIISKMPAPYAEWARTLVIVVGGIILLIFIVSLISGGGPLGDLTR